MLLSSSEVGDTLYETERLQDQIDIISRAPDSHAVIHALSDVT